jgi:hypothetical protein
VIGAGLAAASEVISISNSDIDPKSVVNSITSAFDKKIAQLQSQRENQIKKNRLGGNGHPKNRDLYNFVTAHASDDGFPMAPAAAAPEDHVQHYLSAVESYICNELESQGDDIPTDAEIYNFRNRFYNDRANYKPGFRPPQNIPRGSSFGPTSQSCHDTDVDPGMMIVAPSVPTVKERASVKFIVKPWNLPYG